MLNRHTYLYTDMVLYAMVTERMGVVNSRSIRTLLRCTSNDACAIFFFFSQGNEIPRCVYT